MNVKEQAIECIDLHNHKCRSHPHQFVGEDTASMSIYVFNETRLFAVVERGSDNDRRIFITYYSLERENISEFTSYKSEEQWTHEHRIEKVNNHSKFAWWKPRQD